MKVIIITESKKNIGYGHINRCYAIAQAFQEKGIVPDFITNNDNKRIFTLIKYRNHDIAIVDSYLKDLLFYKMLSDRVKLIVCLDDNNRLKYPKGIVINGNVYAKNIDYPKNNQITYLLGTKYTTLRKAFWEVPEKKIREKIESIMVTFGGGDTKNMTPKILSFLNDRYPDLIKNVIIGKSFNNIDDIKKCSDKNTSLIYHPGAVKMKEIMLKSDIAISAGGQTLYELARVGVPTIGVCVADNQFGNIRGWEKIGFLENAGWYNKDNIITRLDILLKMLKNIKLRKIKSTVGKKLIDGRAGFRIYESLTKQGQK